MYQPMACGPNQFMNCLLQVPDGISTEMEGNHLGALTVIGLCCTIQAQRTHLIHQGSTSLMVLNPGGESQYNKNHILLYAR